MTLTMPDSAKSKASLDAVLIAGPTASGKSQAALSLAQSLGGIIINADSMQVYREFRILTARPSNADMNRVPHLLYGHVPATEPYSVARYERDARAALAHARSLKRLPIFVGGTGLYFHALTKGLSAIPPVPRAVREAAKSLRDAIGAEAFHAELGKRDPAIAARLKAGDTQRTLRAFEVFEATGRPLSEWQGKSGPAPLDGWKLGRLVLDPPRDVLRARIAERFEKMLDEGALAEAQAPEILDPALPAANILGLRQLRALARDEVSKAEAVSSAVTATRQYAKRQSTWFRNQMPDWHRLDPLESNFITRMAEILS